MLNWFTSWKQLHESWLASKEATKFNFFADETWNCIQALILAQVATIQLHCIEKGESVNPRVMNTDVVEWFFGACRQMVGGATNKLKCKG